MIGKKFAVALAAVFVMASCCACFDDIGGPNTPETPGSQETPEKPEKPGGTVSAPPEFHIEDYSGLPAVQFSSVYAVEESGSCKLKFYAPRKDCYDVSYSLKAVSSFTLYDEQGNVIQGEKLEGLKSGQEGARYSLEEGQVVYGNIIPVKTAARIAVTAVENESPLPFELGALPDPASFDTTGSEEDPLQPARLNYVKREETLYVYCNAPEDIKSGPQVVNKCITRQDVSDQTVYFTFEQQTDGLTDLKDPWHFESNGVYYGYRVTNTGEDDLYITVRNIGWQLDGAGAYLGEKEWIDFYNTRFELPDLSDLNESQKRLYDGYYSFSGEYTVHTFQPTTYRIPAGKYMYVMGGTTKDAFGGFNVDNTANRLSTKSTCANGAVLFDVVGKAEGAYYVYNDIAAVSPGGEGYDTHMGLDDPQAYGVVHTGEDVGYVVDNQATWTFNDATPSQKLPVAYTNYYSDTAPTSGKPNTPIPGTTAHENIRTEWATHLDVQQAHDAVGTDMTTFHTVNRQGERIQVGCNYYDTRGLFPNIGNWMKDYQDAFTFVNQGDKEREITVNMHCTGAVVVVVRDPQGRRVDGTAGYSMVHGDADTFGKMEQGFDKAFHYTVKIPAHSVVQFVVEYNLMANSTGYVRHSVDLK